MQFMISMGIKSDGDTCVRNKTFEDNLWLKLSYG